MSLEDWLSHAWLTRHETSSQEIAQLLAAADRDLADCLTPGLSADEALRRRSDVATLGSSRPSPLRAFAIQIL